MATREGKKNAVEDRICIASPKTRIVRLGGQAKRASGKLTRRGDS
jgi:hypothetical protein